MSRLYDNIKYACKIGNVCLGDIESPMSPGIISRYEKGGRILNLPVWILAKLSAKSGVSVDDMLNKDLTVLSELTRVRADIDRLRDEEHELLQRIESEKSDVQLFKGGGECIIR